MKSSWIAVARSEQDATLIMIEAVSGTRMGLHLVETGDAVLAAARQHNIGNDQAREV